MPLLSDRDDRALLSEMRDALASIQRYASGLTHDAYIDAPMVRDAVAMRLVVLGEAANHLSDAVKERHPDVRWRQITSLRNILAHNYAAADQDIIWILISEQIEPLDRQLAHIESETA